MAGPKCRLKDVQCQAVLLLCRFKIAFFQKNMPQQQQTFACPGCIGLKIAQSTLRVFERFVVPGRIEQRLRFVQ